MKELLYLFEDINYRNGVRTVTAEQICQLKSFYKITLFSLTRPNEQSLELFNAPIIGIEIWEMMDTLSKPCMEVLRSPQIGTLKKLKRLWYALWRRMSKQEPLERLLTARFFDIFESFDIVIVLNETSRLRPLAARLTHPKKVQWIHTCYALWRAQSAWARAQTANDGILYQSFDWIVTLSLRNRESFISIWPQLAARTVSIMNLMPDELIREKAMQPCLVELEPFRPWMVTICRFEASKAIDRLIRVAERLKKAGQNFCWYLVGSGESERDIKRHITTAGLQDTVILTGALENPYPLLKQCDLFVLPSVYDGTPVTICEALILGIPVAATDVGGIADLIENGINGLLLQNTEEEIFEGLFSLLHDSSRLLRLKKGAQGYHYDNMSILQALQALLEA